MAIITELENSLQDTRPREVKFLNSVKNRILERDGNTNSSTVPNINLQLIKYEPNQVVGGGASLNAKEGFYFATFIQGYNLLPQPSFNYKLNNIKDITLSINIFADADDIGGYSPPVITDFSIDFYLSMHLLPASEANIYTSKVANKGVINSRAMSIPFTFNFFASDPLLFTITNSNQQFNLSNTIPSRNIIGPDAVPDFNTNPTQITQNQYNLLTSSNVSLLTMFGWNESQRASLSVNNRQLFDELFNETAPVTSKFSIGVNASLSYFGQTASFTPIN